MSALARREALLESVTREVRRAFQRLAALGGALHADAGVTPAMRAVMEWLTDHGPSSVPAIARAKDVSRQHIQMQADALLSRGLAVAGENPAHRRSPLLALSPEGKALFRAMRMREARLLAALAPAFHEAELLAALGALERLNDLVSEERRAALVHVTEEESPHDRSQPPARASAPRRRRAR